MAYVTAVVNVVVNVNGLSARDPNPDNSSNWKDLTAWMDEQERYFSRRRIVSDEEMIDHVIMNLDVGVLFLMTRSQPIAQLAYHSNTVHWPISPISCPLISPISSQVRHWSKLENFYKYNQREKITFEMLKRVLCKKVNRVIDPTMVKYDEKVDGYVDKLNIMNLNFTTFQTWMKKLRSLCDGQGKEDYLTRKILARVMDSHKETVYRNLLQEIKDYVEQYGSRLRVNEQSVGKEKKKELAKLAIIKDTLIAALRDL